MSKAIKKSSKKALHKKQRKRFYRDMSLMLIAPSVLAVYYYGLRAMLLIAVSVFTALAADVAGSILTGKGNRLYNCSSLFIGWILALMMPASAPVWLCVVASIFAVFVGVVPFGGAFSSPFCAAAAGYSFISICWSDIVFAYPIVEHGKNAVIYSSADFTPGSSLANMIMLNDKTRIGFSAFFDSLSGAFPGPMGFTSVAVIIGAVVWLLVRQPKSLINSAGFVLTTVIGALIFPRVSTGPVQSVYLEITSGLFLVCAVFFITDAATSPKKNGRRFLYGVIGGIICVLLKQFGAYEDSCCIAILILNSVWLLVEKYLVKAENHKKSRAVHASEGAEVNSVE